MRLGAKLHVAYAVGLHVNGRWFSGVSNRTKLITQLLDEKGDGQP